MDQLLEELRKDVLTSNSKVKHNIAQKKPTKKNKKSTVPKVAPVQIDAATSKVQQIQL